MTAQTIPEYLEEEREQAADNQLRMEEEVARIGPLQHGHHRTGETAQAGTDTFSQRRKQEEEKEKNRRGSSEEATRREKDGNENPQESLTRIFRRDGFCRNGFCLGRLRMLVSYPTEGSYCSWAAV
jgi:hypothetical protein